MAHAASHIKKARSEMDQPPDLKALEKARERRKRSRERAERKRKVEADSRDHPRLTLHPTPSHPSTLIIRLSFHDADVFIRVRQGPRRALVFMVTDCPHLCLHSHLERHRILMITQRKVSH